MYIVKDGKSEYTLVYSDKASEAEIFACEEFRDLVFAISGANIPILCENRLSAQTKIIAIGDTALGEKFVKKYKLSNKDGFVIESRGKNLFICGGNDRGTIYGVYEYFERYFGVRFYAEDCTKIIQKKDVEFYGQTVIDEPAFDMRNYYSFQITGWNNNQLFRLRCRINNEFEHIEKKYGGDSPWNNDGDPTHNSLRYVPVEKYLNKNNAENYHPEFYWYYLGEVMDICLSNGVTEDGKFDSALSESAVKAVSQSFIKAVKENPDKKYFMFGMSDLGVGCPCHKCRKAAEKYKRSGLVIRFINIVSDLVKEWMESNNIDRKVLFVIFAYNYTQEAPVIKSDGKYYPIDKTVIPRDNIYVRLATLEVNEYYPYLDKRQKDFYRELYPAWLSVCDRLMSWTYHGIYRTVPFAWYCPTMDALDKNIKFFKKINMPYVMFQGNYGEKNDWQSIMYTYVASKLLWNPSFDAEYLQNEFIDGYFEEGADAVRAVKNILDGIFRRASENSKYFELSYYNSVNILDAENYPIEDLEKALAAVKEGYVKIQNSLNKEALKFRLERVRLMIEFMICFNYDAYYTEGRSERLNKFVRDLELFLGDEDNLLIRERFSALKSLFVFSDERAEVTDSFSIEKGKKSKPSVEKVNGNYFIAYEKLDENGFCECVELVVSKDNLRTFEPVLRVCGDNENYRVFSPEICLIDGKLKFFYTQSKIREVEGKREINDGIFGVWEIDFDNCNELNSYSEIRRICDGVSDSKPFISDRGQITMSADVWPLQYSFCLSDNGRNYRRHYTVDRVDGEKRFSNLQIIEWKDRSQWLLYRNGRDVLGFAVSDNGGKNHHLIDSIAISDFGPAFRAVKISEKYAVIINNRSRSDNVLTLSLIEDKGLNCDYEKLKEGVGIGEGGRILDFLPYEPEIAQNAAVGEGFNPDITALSDGTFTLIYDNCGKLYLNNISLNKIEHSSGDLIDETVELNL